jgi:hypothetical protein
MSEALAEGMTVVDYAPGSPLAEDFNTLAGWVKSLSAPANGDLSRGSLEREMTVTGLWQEIGAGENIVTRFFRLAFPVAAAVVFCFLAALPLTWPQQAVCGLLTLLMAMALARSSDSYLITLSLMMMSMFCTLRYGYWRVTQTVYYFQDPATHWGALDAFFILSLLAGRGLRLLVILFLGYFQTIWPLRRAPVELPDDESEWPHVDVLIPTYNEPLDVVRYTALGALNMDWPADKLHVYILDDGRRKEFEQFAFEAGVGYRSRTDNATPRRATSTPRSHHDSPYVAIFDCDHVPTRSFLQMTVGWMLRDPSWPCCRRRTTFIRPIPFERNLGQFRVIPNEGELFYGIVQDGNDFWNATFFCGSCAVLRREALNEIGGIAVETVTEDAHTSLRMQMNGWGTAYINIPQAAGLATERLSAHVGQRIRWARGMIQILRTRQSAVCAGLKLAAAPVLLQRHVPLSLRRAAADLSLRAADLSAAQSHQHSRLLGGHSGLRAAAPDSGQRDQLAHPGRAPALLLERDLRDGARALHSAAHHDGADQSQAGQVQRDGQGRRGEADVFRRAHRAAVPGHAGVQLCRAAGRHSALFHLGPRPPAR